MIAAPAYAPAYASPYSYGHAAYAHAAPVYAHGKFSSKASKISYNLISFQRQSPRSLMEATLVHTLMEDIIIKLLQH